MDPTLTKEFQKLYTAASKCAEVRILLDVRFQVSPGVSLDSCFAPLEGMNVGYSIQT